MLLFKALANSLKCSDALWPIGISQCNCLLAIFQSSSMSHWGNPVMTRLLAKTFCFCIAFELGFYFQLFTQSLNCPQLYTSQTFHNCSLFVLTRTFSFCADFQSCAAQISAVANQDSPFKPVWSFSLQLIHTITLYP